MQQNIASMLYSFLHPCMFLVDSAPMDEGRDDSLESSDGLTDGCSTERSMVVRH